MKTAPPLRSIVALLVLAVLIVAGVVVMYTVTPPAQRGSLLAWVGGGFAVLLPTGTAILAWLSSNSADQSATSAAISSAQTAEALNGGFEDRVKGIIHEALNEREQKSGA